MAATQPLVVADTQIEFAPDAWVKGRGSPYAVSMVRAGTDTESYMEPQPTICVQADALPDDRVKAQDDANTKSKEEAGTDKKAQSQTSTPLSMGILQARTLEWVAMPSSRALTLSLFKYKWHLHGSQQLIKDFHIYYFI